MKLTQDEHMRAIEATDFFFGRKVSSLYTPEQQKNILSFMLRPRNERNKKEKDMLDLITYDTNKNGEYECACCDFVGDLKEFSYREETGSTLICDECWKEEV